MHVFGGWLNNLKIVLRCFKAYPGVRGGSRSLLFASIFWLQLVHTAWHCFEETATPPSCKVELCLLRALRETEQAGKKQTTTTCNQYMLWKQDYCNTDELPQFPLKLQDYVCSGSH